MEKTLVVLLSLCLSLVSADVSHLFDRQTPHSRVSKIAYNTETTTTTTPAPGPPGPYVFSYQAGRAPGHVDRQHTEVSDGTGVIRGAFSYVDPKNQVRTVQYVADEHGFYPQLSHAVEDTATVQAAKRRHFELYNRIAQDHAYGAPEPETALPRQSEAVSLATQKHLSLYERIAAEHAAIGAQQEAARLALEANAPKITEEVYDENNLPAPY